MIQLPLFETPSLWVPPSHLPDLSDAKEIAVDTEGKDPHLRTKGPGYIRRDGFVAGIGIATDTGFSGYFPIAHAGGGNLDSAIVCSWLRTQLARQSVDYIFANAQHDLGWLRTLNVEVGGRINDIQIADTLLDEERPEGYSLDALCARWGEPSKDEELLREACLNWSLDNPKADLWKLPAKYVGAYGEADPVRTLRIWQKQKPVLIEQGLWKAYELERELTPILFEMFWRGIRVDTNFASQLNERWLADERRLLRELGLTADDLWTTNALARLCDRNGIRYPRTAPSKNFPSGQPSITKEFMEHSQHPLLMKVRHARAVQRTRSVYLEQNLLTNVINGRIHPQYIQMASDDGGTRTMRLSCRNPNAQQFPKRSTLFDAKSLRKCLIPEDGELWAKRDYWGQEPVIQLHYAKLDGLPGTEAVEAEFKKGVKLAQYAEKASNGTLNYDQAKQVILARSYNQQPKGMSETTGMPIEKCEELMRRLRPARSLHRDSQRPPQDEGHGSRICSAARRPQAPLQLLGSPVLETRHKAQGHRLDTDNELRRSAGAVEGVPHCPGLHPQGVQRPVPGWWSRADQDGLGAHLPCARAA